LCAFLALLRRAAEPAVLRAMHNVGLLARLIPEISASISWFSMTSTTILRLDEHTLRAIGSTSCTSAKQTSGVSHAVFEQVKDPTLLYLALLLHDIAKVRGAPYRPRRQTCRKVPPPGIG
jgi:[protein-PII] uridylyltransferase